MPAPPDHPELKWLGNYSVQARIAFAEIEPNYGKGAKFHVGVGHSEGMLYFGLTYSPLPQYVGPTIIDVEDGSTPKRRSVYLWDFFVRRKGDQSPFYILNPLDRESYVLVKFAESRLSYQMFSIGFYTSGIQLRQHRVRVP